MKRYILKGREPVACEDLLQWAQWLETADRTVEETFIQHPTTDVMVSVSTVFLAMNYRFSSLGPPILFETMAFGEPETITLFGQDRLIAKSLGHERRYCTWDEALIGHREVHEDILRSMAIEATQVLHTPNPS